MAYITTGVICRENVDRYVYLLVMVNLNQGVYWVFIEVSFIVSIDDDITWFGCNYFVIGINYHNLFYDNKWVISFEKTRKENIFQIEKQTKLCFSFTLTYNHIYIYRFLTGRFSYLWIHASLPLLFLIIRRTNDCTIT